MNAQDPQPPSEHSDDSPVKTPRELRSEGYALLEKYQAGGLENLLDEAENSGWAAYSASKTDDGLSSALCLIARTLMYKESFGTALEYANQALGFKPNDPSTISLVDEINAAEKAAKPVAKQPLADFERVAADTTADDLPRHSDVKNTLPDYEPQIPPPPEEKQLSFRYRQYTAPAAISASDKDTNIVAIEHHARPWPEPL